MHLQVIQVYIYIYASNQNICTFMLLCLSVCLSIYLSMSIFIDHNICTYMYTYAYMHI